MTFKLDRRQFLWGTSALAAASAVGPAFAQADQLRLIFWGSQARADRTYGVTDLWAKDGGTPIQGEFYAWNDYWPKLATQTAGGNAPDIIQMDYRYIVEYATRNAIAPLDEFMGGALDLTDFDQDQLEGGKVDGKLYGISLGANSVALAINTDAFAKAGVEVPGQQTTYDDLYDMADKFAAANVGMKVIQDGSYSEPALENWLRQRGKALYTADGKLGFDADDATAWFKLWADLRDKGVCVSAEDQALDTGPLETTMLTLGKAAIIFSNSNQLVAHQALNKAKLTISNFPRIATDAPGGHYRKPSMFFSVAGGSSAKENAAKFVDYFVTDIDANMILGVERGIPCSKAVRDALAPTLDAQSQIALNFVANLGPLVGPLPPSPPAAAGEIDSTLIRTLGQEVGFGQISPEDAGPSFVEQANEILHRAAG
jgi:multiple sugar transport system substrate-binding protein